MLSRISCSSRLTMSYRPRPPPPRLYIVSLHWLHNSNQHSPYELLLHLRSGVLESSISGLQGSFWYPEVQWSTAEASLSPGLWGTWRESHSQRPPLPHAACIVVLQTQPCTAQMGDWNPGAWTWEATAWTLHFTPSPTPLCLNSEHKRLKWTQLLGLYIL